MERILSIGAAVIVVAGTLGVYYSGSNWVLYRVVADRVQPDGTFKSREGWRAAISPWLFAGPALFLLGVFLVYPVIQTIRLSFFNTRGTRFVGVRNYEWALENPEFRQAIANNVLWLMVVPFACIVFGLVIAMLADRVRWGTIAKSLIFMPMAISFVGASVIWKFVYDFRGPGKEQIGVLNALVVSLGGEPQAWIALPFWNNFFLMIILIWIETGFAMVVLSAAIRNIPEELLDAARDALERFRSSSASSFRDHGTILVMWTTITIIVRRSLTSCWHDEWPVGHRSTGELDVRLDVSRRRRFWTGQHAGRSDHGSRLARHGVEYSSILERGRSAMSRRLPLLGFTLGGLIARAALILIVLLWTIPTFGLFISSLRDKDQLAVSGWWTALRTMSANARGRTGDAADQFERDGNYVIAGSILPAGSNRSVATYGGGFLPGT
jgi:alpha-glucoside transport system permease protein